MKVQTILMALAAVALCIFVVLAGKDWAQNSRGTAARQTKPPNSDGSYTSCSEISWHIEVGGELYGLVQYEPTVPRGRHTRIELGPASMSMDCNIYTAAAGLFAVVCMLASGSLYLFFRKR